MKHGPSCCETASVTSPHPHTRASGRSAVVAHYDLRAPTYDTSSLHRGLTEAIADWLDERGERDVLDVATGTGLMLRSLQRRRPEIRLIGVDLAPGMLAIARAELPSATLVLSDAGRLPLPTSSVDLVSCIAALHLLPDPSGAVAEWARVLRPAGRLVTATFADVPTSPTTQHFPRWHERFVTHDKISALVTPAGLTVDRHRRWTHTDELGRPTTFQLCTVGPGRMSGP